MNTFFQNLFLYSYNMFRRLESLIFWIFYTFFKGTLLSTPAANSNESKNKTP